MKLRKFTEAGANRFVAFLIESQDVVAPKVPSDLLEDPIFSEQVAGVDTPAAGIKTKLAFAEAMHATFSGLGIDELLRTDKCLWMWLTARYFDDLCRDAQGNPRCRRKSISQYASTGLGRDYGLDKNLLYFPWKMLLLHGADARWCLEFPLGEDTKVLREFANSARTNVFREFIKLARRLYYDESRRAMRRGATGEKAPGSLRELDRTFSRLDMTYDVFGVDADQLLAMLPKNRFERWLKHA